MPLAANSVAITSSTGVTRRVSCALNVAGRITTAIRNRLTARIVAQNSQMNDSIELGVDTFGDVSVGADGQQLSQAQTVRNVVEQGVLADQVGLHFIGLGEHHRPDFAISAPEVIAAAIAARTSRIRIGTAVTVLSTDDPVRVFQRFSTINAISNGRAEVIVGRGSFTESFPLFGYDLALYEQLFEEKLNLWRSEERRVGKECSSRWCLYYYTK